MGGKKLASDAGSAGGRRVGERPFPERPEGADSLPQIDHLLVLMMENHSYDNYLGMLGRGPGASPRGDGFTIGPDGRPTAANPAPGSGTQHAFRMPTTCQLSGKPSPEWEQAHVQFDGGRNDGFVRSASGPVAMGYWTGQDPPWAYSLAATFPLADRWFASLLGQTQPNRRYLLAARDHASVVPIAQFFADAKSGHLPGFAIIDPDFGRSSGENPQNIVHAEVFPASVVQAVMESPAWPRTLLVWTFDEGGGTTTTCRRPPLPRQITFRHCHRPRATTGSPGTGSGCRRSWYPRGAGQTM